MSTIFNELEDGPEVVYELTIRSQTGEDIYIHEYPSEVELEVGKRTRERAVKSWADEKLEGEDADKYL